MSVVKWIRKKSRLSQMIGQPGGVTVRNALARAEENLAEMRDDCLTAVVEAVTSLERMLEAEVTDPNAWLEEVYRLSSSALDAVGPFGLEDVATAAFSLCELADRLQSAGRCEKPWVEVHVRALRLLLQLPPEAVEGRRELLAGLERVLAKAPRTAP